MMANAQRRDLSRPKQEDGEPKRENEQAPQIGFKSHECQRKGVVEVFRVLLHETENKNKPQQEAKAKWVA